MKFNRHLIFRLRRPLRIYSLPGKMWKRALFMPFDVSSNFELTPMALRNHPYLAAGKLWRKTMFLEISAKDTV